MVEILLLSGVKKDYALTEANAVERAKIFKTHLRMNDFLAASKQSSSENSDITKFLKDTDAVFEFINDVLKAGFKGLDLNELSASEADRLSGLYLGKILGIDSKN